jgi:hypothetical protein
LPSPGTCCTGHFSIEVPNEFRPFEKRRPYERKGLIWR